MDAQKVITALNKAVSLEHAATLQYQQHALLVNGLWRKVFADFFEGQSKTAPVPRPYVWPKDRFSGWCPLR